MMQVEAFQKSVMHVEKDSCSELPDWAGPTYTLLFLANHVHCFLGEAQPQDCTVRLLKA